MKSIIYVERQYWSGQVWLRFLHCYIALNFVIIMQKISC
jgi:hypothetical protein